ncbi:CoA-binding protein [Thermodesulfobacteriota bacterium]
MTKRNEEITPNLKFGERFPPESIAIVGISRKEEWIPIGYTGLQIFRTLRESGFSGRVYPVNPKAQEIEGVKAYPNVASIPERPDLVIITVPAPRVPQVIDDCVAAGAYYVIIISSGFAETGEEEGKKLEELVLEKALKGGLRIIGPNCVGFNVPSVNMQMSLTGSNVKGSVAFICQSGGHTEIFLQYGPTLGLGFSKAISYGNAMMLDVVDFLEYLADDPETEIICLYLEGIKNGRKLIELVKKVIPMKPVIVWKGGLTKSGSRVAVSHTASLTGDREIWNAFFKQTGAIEVDSIMEMAEVAMTFQHLSAAANARAAVIGQGGGSTVSNADICAREGVETPRFSSETQEGLFQMFSLVNQGLSNPMDVPSLFANPKYLNRTLRLLEDDPAIDMIIFCVQAQFLERGEYFSIFKNELIKTMQNNAVHKPIVVAISGEWHVCGVEPVIREMRQTGITIFNSINSACKALKRFAMYHQFIRGNSTTIAL